MIGLKLFWFIKFKKLFFSHIPQLCYIYASYMLLRLCVGMSVCLSLVFIISDRILSAYLQGAWEDTPDLFIDLFHYVWILYFMTWHGFSWLDNPVCQSTCDPGSHLLIISSVLCEDGNENYEQLVHWGEFGSNVWMHKDSTGQTTNQVMTPFQQ
jgi:hypothetical protein